MMLARLILALILVALPLSAMATPAYPVYADPAMATAATNTYKMPDVVSFGAGWFDVDKNTPRRQAADFRFEYRWQSTSLLPMTSDYFSSWEKWFQIHPMAGLETTHRGQLYGFGGLVFDVLLGRHVVFSPNIAIGLYERGDGKRLGSFVEFRSTLELGYRFDNEMRVTGFFGHISNAGLTDLNPGAEAAGMYLHVPTNLIFGH